MCQNEDRRTTERGSPKLSASGAQPTNTHILAHRFGYLRPTSLPEASAALEEHPDAAILAGGTNLLVDMKMERTAPASPSEPTELPGPLPSGQPAVLVDISRLPGLSEIDSAERRTTIGALTPIRNLAVSEPLWREHSCLAEAAAAFGSTQVAMMGTLGGNVANGSPASDTVPALVVLGATAMIVGSSGERTALIADLLEGPGRIALERGELIRSVVLPAPQGSVGSAFLKLSRVRADLAKVSVAARLVRDGETIVGARIALGSVGPTVIRAKRASSMLAGKPFSKDLILNAARQAASEIQPIDEVRSTADYRRKAAVALVFDAVSLAWNRTKEEVRGQRGSPVSSTLLGTRPMQAESTDLVPIELVVNGKAVSLSVSPNELLLNVLRDRLELTGSKYGCGIGECGACTVWMNGTPVLGCLVLAVSADGADIRTIEGEAVDGRLSDLQSAFIAENAFQCGYCTPGMLMMTKRLLEEIPQPTEDEIRDYLKGNHCRCTGYAAIVRAVHAAVQKGAT